jgi:hypothetical protein
VSVARVVTLPELAVAHAQCRPTASTPTTNSSGDSAGGSATITRHSPRPRTVGGATRAASTRDFQPQYPMAAVTSLKHRRGGNCAKPIERGTRATPAWERRQPLWPTDFAQMVAEEGLRVRRWHEIVRARCSAREEIHV